MVKDKPERRYDLDWLRVIAVLLLIVYHCAIAFQPWAHKISFIQNVELMEGLWTAMEAMNIWRIPLIFVISGFAFASAMRARSVKEALIERTTRILVPAVFCSLLLVPLQFFVFQHYENIPLSYHAEPSYTWFLLNIFVYVLLTVTPLHWLKNKNELPAMPTLLSLPALFVLEAIFVTPEMYANFYMTMHGLYWALPHLFLVS
ncbi:hypothetical protein CS022_03625 [Veronia nyctiphanis]|uniref:Acyltransferase 3 domain-containing protein n=1 Tax=Veronia nyctiphanis TaxID=1278244 RepID=A0A4Q0YUY9_9GAMM|nr:acyltransferase family protein [Veronia nyctiphanis]RXJ74653.1 hypothetical protein CS022_03625 [Veronia nyctiphanis]